MENSRRGFTPAVCAAGASTEQRTNPARLALPWSGLCQDRRQWSRGKLRRVQLQPALRPVGLSGVLPAAPTTTPFSAPARRSYEKRRVTATCLACWPDASARPSPCDALVGVLAFPSEDRRRRWSAGPLDLTAARPARREVQRPVPEKWSDWSASNRRPQVGSLVLIPSATAAVLKRVERLSGLEPDPTRWRRVVPTHNT